MLSSRPISVHHDGGQLKTPGRALAKHRRENVVGGAPTTVGPSKSKRAGLISTPLKGKLPQTEAKPQHLFTIKDADAPAQTISRPLGDKTPFPNRAQPALFPAVPSKLAFSLEPSTQTTPLPSSTRKSFRRRSGSATPQLSRPGLVPSELQQNFQTPAVNGCPWDVTEADYGELKLDGLGAVQEAEVEVEEREDDDEIEYMPPKVPEQSWKPDFDMPDYKEIGKAVLHGHLRQDLTPQDPLYYNSDEERELMAFVQSSVSWDNIKLTSDHSDDDDNFLALHGLKRKVAASQPAAKVAPITLKPVRSAPSSARPANAAATTVVNGRRQATVAPAFTSRAASSTSTKRATQAPIATTSKPSTVLSRVASKPPPPRPAAAQANPVRAARTATSASGSSLVNKAATLRPVRELASSSKSTPATAAARAAGSSTTARRVGSRAPAPAVSTSKTNGARAPATTASSARSTFTGITRGSAAPAVPRARAVNKPGRIVPPPSTEEVSDLDSDLGLQLGELDEEEDFMFDV